MNVRPCNARRPGGVERCTEAFRHDKGPKPTKHSDGEGMTWGEEWAEAPVARSRIREKSDDKIEDDARWALIKSSMVVAQKLTNGHTSCMECRAQDPPILDLDHIKSRARGGRSTPWNARLVCRPCHASIHGEPQFSKVVRLGERAS